MKDIVRGDLAIETWESSLGCLRCHTVFTVDETDLEADYFKRPGTYFFDGSADAAGLTFHTFVYCPISECRYLTWIDDAVPFVIRKRLKDALKATRGY